MTSLSLPPRYSFLSFSSSLLKLSDLTNVKYTQTYNESSSSYFLSSWYLSIFCKSFFSSVLFMSLFLSSFSFFDWNGKCVLFNFYLCIYFIFNWTVVALQRCVGLYVQQSESAAWIHVSLLSWISFLLRSPQSIFPFFFFLLDCFEANPGYPVISLLSPSVSFFSGWGPFSSSITATLLVP